MFSKAKRFEPLGAVNNQSNVPNKPDDEHRKINLKTKITVATSSKPTLKSVTTSRSQSSSVKSVKSFTTPKPVKPNIKSTVYAKKLLSPSTKDVKSKAYVKDDLAKEQEVEIRNKDFTITEYSKQIEELKNEIGCLKKKVNESALDNKSKDIEKKLSMISLTDNQEIQNYEHEKSNCSTLINDLTLKITQLELQCEKLEEEVSSKQVELTSLEEIITIRDTLCKDLQEKLTSMETCVEETRQRLEMVKGHHALALEANESIRREYKAELETLKSKFEDEKLIIVTKSKADQESVKSKYVAIIESIRKHMQKEKEDVLNEMQQQLDAKDLEMKAKLEQIDETAQEKLKLCEIQFEERSRTIQEHWEQQQEQIHYLEKEVKDLKYSLNVTEEEKDKLYREASSLTKEVEILKAEKETIIKKTEDLKEDSKKKMIDFENQVNKLTVEVDKAIKEKHKFEMSLSVTRDIVQVLTMRLRESDNELEHLEYKVQNLTESKEVLENDLTTYKNSLNNTILECNEYKEALVNILKSKAALAKEHTRIMEHNVSLIESLQNVEIEAYRELGSIKTELIEDVEMLKKESSSQIQMLREEVEKKSMLCELATEHAGQATAAAEQSRALLTQAAAEIARLEADNQRLQQQIQDQQSLVVELSLLRQENEELTIALSKQSSIVEKIKKDAEQTQPKPKSPSMVRKGHKTGKENLHVVVSPLRERNH
ncbi:COP1-interactive protein 1-like [Hyposmocoma kahamanoa]|uniref:COP1-interactive protein 1-like n=1 Tax=Hyposmocoma kahamanoa TaxID=1477025 RepID=UPI000E6D7281|nr:COP1-interactive protein 1-like [Hyposmocoma kahamanoa]